MTIKEAREKTGLSRKEMAEVFKIPYRTLQNWELGSRECPEWAEMLIIEKLERMEENKMKIYTVIDDCTTKRASIFDETFQTEQEALQYAESEWSRLTDHDKNNRDAFYVATCSLGEDGEIDWDSIDPIKEYK